MFWGCVSCSLGRTAHEKTSPATLSVSGLMIGAVHVCDCAPLCDIACMKRGCSSGRSSK
jgi:hypothetical protein